jgi:hypothetical protein
MLGTKTPGLLAGVAAVSVVAFGVAYAQQGPRGKSSYMEGFASSSRRERPGRLSRI